jgi:hypothetical protein
MRKITTDKVTVAHFRNKTEAGLTYLSAPGSTMWMRDPETGEERFIKAGDVIESDDGTINFPVCVPWEIGGDKCSDRYKVRVGRFQWLPAIDVGSRFYPAYNYICRPSGSYRAEDILTLMRALTRQHGVPGQFRFEQGSWKANRVKDVIRLMGSQLHTVYSPRQKPYIEGGFNICWTKLSVYFPGCDVGRFMGETEAANELLTRCKDGREDPRKHFPMLSDAIAAFDSVLAERNRTPVHSKLYGTWVPEERWAEQLAERPMRQIDPAMDWIFSPYMRGWTVRQCQVEGMIPLFDELSVPYNFSGDFLSKFEGAKVRAYFDPTEVACAATIVLAESFRDHRVGEVLGVARQTNKVASYARRMMLWADDSPDIGRQQRQQNARAMTRNVRVISGGGRISYSETEIRDGVDKKITICSGDSSAGAREGATPADGGACLPPKREVASVSLHSVGRNVPTPLGVGRNNGTSPVDAQASAGADRRSELARLRAATESLERESAHLTL